MKKPDSTLNKFADWEKGVMTLALGEAQRAYGFTSPNPMVGAVLTLGRKVMATGFHRGAGFPHAEEEAISAAWQKKVDLRRCTLFVSLEPCSTRGRRPPCTDLIIKSGIREVVVAATDPNPVHAGRGFTILRRAGIKVRTGLLEEEASRLNEAFNFWIVKQQPWITLKLAMTLDGKIAGGMGRSRWITSARSRRHTMELRQGADAILVGVNTILQDNPSLTLRGPVIDDSMNQRGKILRRILLDPKGRILPSATVLRDGQGSTTWIVAGSSLANRLQKKHHGVKVQAGKMKGKQFDLRALMRTLGSEGVTHLLVEGGGETIASFIEQGLGNRVAFFYAPKLIPNESARKAIGGDSLEKPMRIESVEWSRLGEDWFLTGLLPGAR